MSYTVGFVFVLWLVPDALIPPTTALNRNPCVLHAVLYRVCVVTESVLLHCTVCVYL